jgi:hypothetical protein
VKIRSRYVVKATLVQRVQALENAVHELREALNARKPAPDWLDRVVGSMKDEPALHLELDLPAVHY